MLRPRCFTRDGDECREAIRLILNGRVQGLGVRPAIYRLATQLGLGGSVRNTPRGVEIENTGSEPLVGLRYFGPDAHASVPKVGGV